MKKNSIIKILLIALPMGVVIFVVYTVVKKIIAGERAIKALALAPFQAVSDFFGAVAGLVQGKSLTPNQTETLGAVTAGAVGAVGAGGLSGLAGAIAGPLAGALTGPIVSHDVPSTDSTLATA